MTDKNQDKAIAIVKEISPLVETAQNLKIINDDTMSASAELLSKCKIHLKYITNEEKTITAPAKLIIETEKARWAVAKDNLETAIDYLRDEQSRYVTDLKKQEAKIASRVKEGSGNLSVESAVAKVAALGTPDKVVTSNGSVKFREIPKLKITDASKVPTSYLIIDEARLFADLKSGLVVEGAEIEMISISVNR